MKKYILIAILLCSYISVSAQYNSADAKLLAYKNSIQQESIGKYAQAILTIKDIYDKYSNEYIINLRLGWLYYLNQDYTNSVKYYKKALQASKDKSIEAIFGITLPLSAQGKWDGVKSYYENVISMDENNYTANLRLGQIYLNTENYLNAKVYLSKVKDMYSGDYEANLYLAWTYYYLGDKSSARELFINVLTLSPGDKSAVEGLKLVE
jgi:tetratricopeptide (TPR) repeat protein